MEKGKKKRKKRKGKRNVFGFFWEFVGEKFFIGKKKKKNEKKWKMRRRGNVFVHGLLVLMSMVFIVYNTNKVWFMKI